MARLPSSGSITLGDSITGRGIAEVFGGDPNHDLAEYNRGGGLVPDSFANQNIPTNISPGNSADFSDYYSGSNIVTDPYVRPAPVLRYPPFPVNVGDQYSIPRPKFAPPVPQNGQESYSLRDPNTGVEIGLDNIGTSENPSFIIPGAFPLTGETELTYTVTDQQGMPLAETASLGNFTRAPISAINNENLVPLVANAGDNFFISNIINVQTTRAINNSGFLEPVQPTVTIGGVQQTIVSITSSFNQELNQLVFVIQGTVAADTPTVPSPVVITNYSGDSLTLAEQFRRSVPGEAENPSLSATPTITWERGRGGEPLVQRFVFPSNFAVTSGSAPIQPYFRYIGANFAPARTDEFRRIVVSSNSIPSGDIDGFNTSYSSASNPVTVQVAANSPANARSNPPENAASDIAQFAMFRQNWRTTMSFDETTATVTIPTFPSGNYSLVYRTTPAIDGSNQALETAKFRANWKSTESTGFGFNEWGNLLSMDYSEGGYFALGVVASAYDTSGGTYDRQRDMGVVLRTDITFPDGSILHSNIEDLDDGYAYSPAGQTSGNPHIVAYFYFFNGQPEFEQYPGPGGTTVPPALGGIPRPGALKGFCKFGSRTFCNPAQDGLDYPGAGPARVIELGGGTSRTYSQNVDLAVGKPQYFTEYLGEIYVVGSSVWKSSTAGSWTQTSSTPGPNFSPFTNLFVGNFVPTTGTILFGNSNYVYGDFKLQEKDSSGNFGTLTYDLPQTAITVVNPEIGPGPLTFRGQVCQGIGSGMYLFDAGSGGAVTLHTVAYITPQVAASASYLYRYTDPNTNIQLVFSPAFGTNAIAAAQQLRNLILPQLPNSTATISSDNTGQIILTVSSPFIEPTESSFGKLSGGTDFVINYTENSGNTESVNQRLSVSAAGNTFGLLNQGVVASQGFSVLPGIGITAASMIQPTNATGAADPVFSNAGVSIGGKIYTNLQSAPLATVPFLQGETFGGGVYWYSVSGKPNFFGFSNGTPGLAYATISGSVTYIQSIAQNFGNIAYAGQTTLTQDGATVTKDWLLTSIGWAAISSAGTVEVFPLSGFPAPSGRVYTGAARTIFNVPGVSGFWNDLYFSSGLFINQTRNRTSSTPFGNGYGGISAPANYKYMAAALAYVGVNGTNTLQGTRDFVSFSQATDPYLYDNNGNLTPGNTAPIVAHGTDNVNLIYVATSDNFVQTARIS